MTIKALVKKHMGTLEHFLTQRAYPIRIDPKEGLELSKAIPALYYDDGKVSKGPALLSLDETKKFPDKVLVEFWKSKYEDERTEANKLYNLIKDAYHKANN